jgi:hypothetical protein
VLHVKLIQSVRPPDAGRQTFDDNRIQNSLLGMVVVVTLSRFTIQPVTMKPLPFHL